MRGSVLSFVKYNLIYTLFTNLVYNFYFWLEVKKTVSIGMSAFLFVMTFLALFIMQTLIFWRKTTKFFSILFVVFNSVASYFIFSYHLVLNKTMLANLFDTNLFEATEWFGISFWVYLMLTCLVPIFFILKIQIQFEEPLKQFALTGKALLLWILMALPMLGYKTNIKIYLKENFNLRYQFVPTSYTYSLVSLASAHFKKVPVLDAEKGMVRQQYNFSDKKTLLVFVLGESARDMNFSLSGYKRDTAAPLRPFLEDMIVFHHTESCGVVTRVSLPCMFSVYDRKNYKEQAIPYTTNALEILQKNGLQLLWLDNELGCNKVCRNIPSKYTCTTRDCVDGLLNDSLRQQLPNLDKDTVVVLHQRGSHGPRYDLRVPQEFRKWQPYCERADYQNCSSQEIVNAYDNTIYYTSFLVAELIETLSKFTDQYNPVVIYISDHGESLGENDVWGHGGDFDVAPPAQKEVPFFVWMPKSTRQAFRLDKACLLSKTHTQKTQDSIFHSLLGLFGVYTDTYQNALDIFGECRVSPDES